MPVVDIVNLIYALEARRLTARHTPFWHQNWKQHRRRGWKRMRSSGIDRR